MMIGSMTNLFGRANWIFGLMIRLNLIPGLTPVNSPQPRDHITYLILKLATQLTEQGNNLIDDGR